MDNVTHTLVGAALAKAGLERRTPLARITLILGANFPDIDVIAVPFGKNFAWRRGVTHGFLALAVLPFVLAGIMLLCDKYLRRRRDPTAPPADYRQLVVLSALSIATHPTLDFMNEYGMRWLMPFQDRWFYADGLFIVDLFILVGLGLGVWLASRRKSDRPARIALAFVAIYVVAMLWITSLGREAVAKAFYAIPRAYYMVAPEPLLPWRRSVIVLGGQGYRFGSWSPFDSLRLGPPWPKGEFQNGVVVPAVAAAKADPKAQAFLRWARFPYYRVVRQGSGTVVSIMDARYAGDWATIDVTVP